MGRAGSEATGIRSHPHSCGVRRLRCIPHALPSRIRSVLSGIRFDAHAERDPIPQTQLQLIARSMDGSWAVDTAQLAGSPDGRATQDETTGGPDLDLDRLEIETKLRLTPNRVRLLPCLPRCPTPRCARWAWQRNATPILLALLSRSMSVDPVADPPDRIAGSLCGRRVASSSSPPSRARLTSPPSPSSPAPPRRLQLRRYCFPLDASCFSLATRRRPAGWLCHSRTSPSPSLMKSRRPVPKPRPRQPRPATLPRLLPSLDLAVGGCPSPVALGCTS